MAGTVPTTANAADQNVKGMAMTAQLLQGVNPVPASGKKNDYGLRTADCGCMGEG